MRQKVSPAFSERMGVAKIYCNSCCILDRKLQHKGSFVASQHNECVLFWFDTAAFPVIEVVVELSVSNVKLEISEEGHVIHDIEGVENVTFCVPGEDEEVFEEL